MHRRLRLISFAPRANAVALICLWAPPGLGGLRQCNPWTSPFRALSPSMEPYSVQFLSADVHLFFSSFFLFSPLAPCTEYSEAESAKPHRGCAEWIHPQKRASNNKPRNYLTVSTGVDQRGFAVNSI